MNEQSTTEQALSGVRVLDVSTVLAAPVAATILGDFGAAVVKVEEPGRGDFTRGGQHRVPGRGRCNGRRKAGTRALSPSTCVPSKAATFSGR